MSTILITIKALIALNCIPAHHNDSGGHVVLAVCTPCSCGNPSGSACLRYQADQAEADEKHDAKCEELFDKLQEAVK